MWTLKAGRHCINLRWPFVGLRGPFVSLKGSSFGLRNSCVGMKGPCDGLREPCYGLPSKWAPFRPKRAICWLGRVCAALRGPSYGLLSKLDLFRPKSSQKGGTRASAPIRTGGRLLRCGALSRLRKDLKWRLRDRESQTQTSQTNSYLRRGPSFGLKRPHVGLRPESA